MAGARRFVGTSGMRSTLNGVSTDASRTT